MTRATLILLVGAIVSSALGNPASDIVRSSGVKGGFAVVLGCEDTAFLAELSKAGFVVQALDTDRGRIAKARKALHAQGLYGKVSVAAFNGKTLPYVDGLVNLVVMGPGSDGQNAKLVNEWFERSKGEVERVLAPRGAVVKPGSIGAPRTASKPVPEGLDDWPMHMYEPGNNAVSKDTIVGPPKRLQWRSGPTWVRSHEFMSSLNAMVSMNGKLFYTMDEGSRMSPVFGEKWRLVCQDAFNGVILWKRDLPSWHTHWWPVKSGPTQVMRRLVAVGAKLYIPLGAGAPLSELDAGTGKTIRTFKGTDGVEEIRISKGVIFLLTSNAVAEQQKFNLKNVEVWGAAGDATGEFKWDNRKRTITAIDQKTGAIRWKKEHPVITLTMAIDNKGLYFHDGKKVVGLNRQTGEQAWTSEALELKKYKLGTATAPSLLVYDGVVVCSQGFDFKDGVLLGVSAKTGKTLWKEASQSSGHSTPDDIHVVDGLIWGAGIARIGSQGGVYKGRDPSTGKIQREFPLDVKHASWFHQRCYRSRATRKFIIPAATGIEYVDVRSKHWVTNHWVRGACIFGVLPANGMTYATPHPCACFMESMVRGFSALAPAMPARRREPEAATRLTKGPAYGRAHQAEARGQESRWPMYRRDPARSGYARTDIRSDAKQSWAADISAKITPPVSAGGLVYVAAVDQHTIHALAEKDGKQQWTFTAGGRIDSPPTLHAGSVIFGCADGYVYSVDAGSGELAWKFSAAPEERMIMNDGQVESAWPVHGSVLIVNDTLYCLAGRSLFLDGGMHLSLLNPKTGELLSSRKHSDIDPATGKSMQLSNQGLKMVPSNSDILSSDGRHIYMKAQKIGLDGKRIFPNAKRARKEYTLSKSSQDGEGAHLFSPAGFLDTVWHHRSYWLYGKAAGSGWGGWMKPGKYVPAGRILVVDGNKSVFGFGREPAFFAQSHVLEYQLFSAKGGVYKRGDWRKVFKNIKNKEASITNWKQNRALPVRKLSAIQFNWRNVNPPLLVRAMVGANDKLIIAGPPDILDETKLHNRFLDPAVTRQIKKQEDAVEGKIGGIMWVVSAGNGRKISVIKIASLPVFDGLIAADKKLFMSTTDGKVICFE